MTNQTCKHCNKTFTDLAPKVFSSHVRWCNSTEDGQKFQLRCSCVICHTSITAQNIGSHFKKHHTVKQPKSVCPQCNLPIFNSNKFCSRSCSAIYNNARKDWSLIRTGPEKGTTPSNYCPYTKVKQCVICGNWHKKKGRTCSPECLSMHLSIQVRGKTGGNRDINFPGIDCEGKHFYYDSSWEIKLATSLSENNIHWIRPSGFILSNGRRYTPDFYLPNYKVYLDPKAKRPGYYRKSLLKIEMFELEFDEKCLVISNKNNLTWGHIQTMLLLNVNR